MRLSEEKQRRLRERRSGRERDLDEEEVKARQELLAAFWMEGGTIRELLTIFLGAERQKARDLFEEGKVWMSRKEADNPGLCPKNVPNPDRERVDWDRE